MTERINHSNSPRWIELKDEEKKTAIGLLVRQYGGGTRRYSIHNEGVFYPNTETYEAIEKAHNNLLSAYLNIRANEINRQEGSPTGVFVVGVPTTKGRVIFFGQIGIGEGRFGDIIKESIKSINSNLSPLTGGKNLIPVK